MFDMGKIKYYVMAWLLDTITATGHQDGSAGQNVFHCV
jgi:hypothetical protein